MKVTKETINGREYTVIWHDKGAASEYTHDYGFMPWQKTSHGYVAGEFSANWATALPPLPRRPKPEDAPLLYRYMAEGFYIRGNTYNDFEGERQECCIMPPTYDDEITGAVHSGNPVDVAIEE